jgi:hypothetical protein
VWTIAAAASLVAAAGCSDPGPSELRGGVAVSFATRAGGAVPAPAFSATGMPRPDFSVTGAWSDTVTSGGDTLIVTSAQLVLRQIELKSAVATGCEETSGSDDCEEIEIGPVLADLPLTPGADQAFLVDIPEGTYSRIDFEVHKVESGNASDAQFLTQHPEFEGRSIRVTGTFNGVAFLFESELDVEQELTLSPPLVVTEDTTANVTILIDIRTWFRTAGGGLVDPATANQNQPNESLVSQNIKDSFHAFEDDDHDGEEGDT